MYVNISNEFSFSEVHGDINHRNISNEFNFSEVHGAVNHSGSLSKLT